MLVALGNVRALDDAVGTLLHAAVATDGNFSGGVVGARNEFPAGAAAEWAVFKRHAERIRSPARDGKAGRWENCGTRGEVLLAKKRLGLEACLRRPGPEQKPTVVGSLRLGL